MSGSKDELIKLAREALANLRKTKQKKGEDDYIKTIPDDKIVSWYEQTNDDAFKRVVPPDGSWKTVEDNLQLYDSLNRTEYEPMSSKDTFDAFDTLGDMIKILDSEIDDVYLELNEFKKLQILNNIISTDIRRKNDKNIEERIKALESALGTKTEHPISDDVRNMYIGGKRRLTRKRKN